METTASNRRIWIQETAPSVAEILKMFPCLRTPQYVSSSTIIIIVIILIFKFSA